MKIKPLFDLLQEINRLFIAGSSCAYGDPRLIKLIPIFKKLGEKSPVFNKLKEQLEFIVNNNNESSRALLEIGVLLYSILYTQVESTSDEELKDLNLLDIEHEKVTNIPYSKLKPLIEALSSSNSGRLEIIKDGYKEGLFKDVRTHRYLADAICDKYSEVSSFVGNVIIPSVGPAMVPYIKEKMDVKGKTYDALRLRILYDFKDKSVDDYIKQALDEGSSNVLVEAINILKDDEKNEDIILSLVSDRRRDVKEAALIALCKQKSKEGIKKSIDLFLSKQFKWSIEPLRYINEREYNEILFKQVKLAFDECFKKNVELSKALEDFQDKLQVLAFKDEDYIFDFFKELYLKNDLEKLSKYNPNSIFYIRNSIEQILLNNNDEKSFTLIRELCEMENVVKKSDYLVSVFFKMAFLRLSKEEMYDVFSKHYINGRLPLSCFCIYSLEENFDKNYYVYNYDFSNLDILKIDKRWVPLLVKGKKTSSKENNYERAQDIRLATVLFNKDEQNQLEGFEKLLKNIANEKNIPIYLKDLVECLIDVQKFNMPEFMLGLIESSKSKNFRHIVDLITNVEILKKFPKSSKDRFLKLFNETKIDKFFNAATIIDSEGKEE